MRKLATLTILALLIISLGVYLRAQATTQATTQGTPQGATEIRFSGTHKITAGVTGTADQAATVSGRPTYIGNVFISQTGGAMQIRADRAAFDPSTNEWTLEGNVRLSLK